MSKNRIIVDLEATCEDSRIREMTYADKEIIEIGACLLNHDCSKVLEKFQIFIRPVIFPNLTAFCIDLTKITQDMVDGASLYVEAMAEFDAWIDLCVINHGEIEHWLSWGDYDRKQFIAHAKILNENTPKICELPHRNLKAEYSKVKGKGREVGVRKALAIEGMAFAGTPHRGLDDALNIARLAPVALGYASSAK